MKILLFGKDGQLGQVLAKALPALGEVIALNRRGLDEVSGDLSKPQEIQKTIQTIKPDVIVNAAAYTQVDKAEDEPELANLVNAESVSVIANEAKALNALLIHYSTDYVFDGSGEKPWLEEDETSPLNVYGASKRRGEEAILGSGCKHLIFRTSWVYGVKGQNFANTILRLAKEREELAIIDDQIGVPSSVDFLSKMSLIAIEKVINNERLLGLYNLVPSGETSWYEFASLITQSARQRGETLNLKTIKPIKSCEYPVKATRPSNSRLSTEKFSKSFGVAIPSWQDGVFQFLVGYTREPS
jgi:dTDP-4-dehydrorhamnose reductase